MIRCCRPESCRPITWGNRRGSNGPKFSRKRVGNCALTTLDNSDSCLSHMRQTTVRTCSSRRRRGRNACQSSAFSGLIPSVKMSSAKKKKESNQPELPIDGVPGVGPLETKPLRASKKAGANANGDSHVLAETTAAPVAQRPFAPGRIELPFHRRVDTSFLQYASYVIRDRAIPNLEDGLKPVQRRILWSLHEKDDGRFIKVATISGHCAQYHPHGEAAISDALVVLVNKRYLIEGQGNFGNVFTGDPPAAPRYIECRPTDLARTETFNDDLTEFVPRYDGRNREPI